MPKQLNPGESYLGDLTDMDRDESGRDMVQVNNLRSGWHYADEVRLVDSAEGHGTDVILLAGF